MDSSKNTPISPDPLPSWSHPADTQQSSVPQSVRVQARRDLFWSNVVRDSLMAMASAAASSSARLSPTPSAAQHSMKPVGNLFDGRMGIITSLGQRIPIADLFPVFACSSTGTQADRDRSTDVQCTVFRITTPTGETYTLPISQIIGIHSVSEELIKQLESSTEEKPDQENTQDRRPFGFGAYTSLSKSEREAAQAAQAAQKSQSVQSSDSGE
ncbi:MAG: hypothetical protein AB8C13_00030 [Phycisphaerales bacterium]